MANVKLTNVTKRFDDVTAVNDINLAVNDGEFLVLVGPSGCGKSTTLRLMSGLETVTEGQVIIGNEDVTDADPHERDISMVFQDYALFPHMTARKNMTFGVKSSTSFDTDEIKERADEAADTLDISDLMDRKPSALSGGEQQRVAIGRTLVRDPEVFLMDEPLANLDAKLRVQMRTELQELHAKLNTTTIYVTHDQEEAMTLADRVVVMNDGEIQQVDPPQLLYDYPVNQFVAEFIGSPSMNIVPAELKTDGTTPRISHPAFEVPITDQPSLQTISDGAVNFGIRPQDLTIVEDPDEYTFELEVTVTETLGDSRLLYGRLGEDGISNDPGEQEVRALAEDPRRNYDLGESVYVRCSPDRILLFDPETGEQIYHAAEDRSTIEAQAGARP